MSTSICTHTLKKRFPSKLKISCRIFSIQKNRPFPFFVGQLRRNLSAFTINKLKMIHFLLQLLVENDLSDPFLPTVAFSQPSSNMCCPRDCVSRHNGGTSGAPLKPLRDDSALPLTPAVVVAKVRKAPHVAGSDAVADHGEDEVDVGRPGAALLHCDVVVIL